MKKELLHAGLLMLLVVIISGCAGLSEKFTSDEKVNLEPFATTTIMMVNTIDYGLERNTSILTKPYLNPEGKPALKRLYQLDEEFYQVLRVIVAYSIKLVNLSSSTRTNQQKVQAFANFIDNLEKPTLKYHISQGNVTKEDYQNLLADIRKQEDLLDAMRAAQPMIEFILQHVDYLTDEIKRQEVLASDEIEQAIDKDYSKEINYVNTLIARRDIVFQALSWVDEHYRGGSTGLRMLNGKHVLKRLGMKSRKINASNVKQVEQDLVTELTAVQQQLDMLEKDQDYYLKVHGELDEQVKFHDQEVRKAKGIIQLWSSAHTKMANGITDPADWFDITNPAGELFGLVKSAIGR